MKNSPLDNYDLLGQSLEEWKQDPDQIPLEFVYHLAINEAGQTIFSGYEGKIKKKRDLNNKGRSKPIIKIPDSKNLRILINILMGADANSGKHFHSFKGHMQTTESHERDHAKIFIDEWNNNYESVNKYEIYVCNKCYYEQAMLLIAAYHKFICKIFLKNIEYDSKFRMEDVSEKISTLQMSIMYYDTQITNIESTKILMKCN